MRILNNEQITNGIGRRLLTNKFTKVILFIATLFSLVVLAVLMYRIMNQGLPKLNLDFLTKFASRRPANAGISGALVGSIWLMIVVVPFSMVIGVGTAIYLEEYAKKNWFTSFIQVNIQNLAGVPSIVFGLLGLTIFVRAMDLDRSILAAGLTMSLLVMPVIVVSAQEALKAVPRQLGEASYGLGATKWQTIKNIILPAAIPGILTGSILAISRAIGETAPLIVVGALAFVNFYPSSIMDSFTVIPIQIYNWTTRPQIEFQEVAAAGIIVLLVFLIIMNSIAIIIRNKFNKRY
ncbi:MAG: phosphate transporter permease [Bacillales bacterium]|jgi:phosphate transport system permease protein|nr:phosphate transporter permease [Bacillales bacterium]